MTLTTQAAKALEKSILHWRENVAAETTHEASVSGRVCALCRAFPTISCVGCPVAMASGQARCRGTPYTAAVAALRDWRDGTGTREQWRIAAQAELDFLISLREPTEQE